MTTQEWLKNATQSLLKAGIPSARLDAELLLAHALGKPREYLFAHPEAILKSPLRKGTAFTVLNGWLERRMTREPVAYIVGEKEFYGRMFRVDKNVLVPRPETEEMIYLLKQIVEYEIGNKKYGELQIIDIGTGSGCLAIITKLELPETTVIAVDTSKDALEVAQENARKHKANVTFLHGSLLEPLLHSSFFILHSILLANLPYVPLDYPINEDARHEPDEALLGGVDGLDLYRELFAQASHLPQKPTLVFTEALPTQHAALTGIAEIHGYRLDRASGFIQVFTSHLK